MKFQCSVIINAPREKVVDLYTRVENLKHWQDGFISYEHIKGEPGAIGSQARMIYKSGMHNIELVETIRVMDLPDEFTALYEARQMVNTMSNHFTALDDQTTRYDAEVEYLQFNGIMPRLMALLFPGMFKKQVQKWMDQLRDFVESR